MSDQQLLDLQNAEALLRDRDFRRYLKLKRLLDATAPASREAFRRLFKSFYGLNARANLSQDFEDRYFDILFAGGRQVVFGDVVRALAPIPTRTGGKSLQFSFASKLIGIHRENSPIYDRHVQTFFGVKTPASHLPDETRIAAVEEFLELVARQYIAWARRPEMRAILNRVAQRDPELARCHDVRLLDLLVWRAGNAKEKLRAAAKAATSGKPRRRTARAISGSTPAADAVPVAHPAAADPARRQDP